MSRLRAWVKTAWVASLIVLWVADRYQVARRARFWRRLRAR